MNCNQIREMLPDLVVGAGMEASAPAKKLRSSRPAKTVRFTCGSWGKLWRCFDEWQTPEPSPYFDTRLNARMRDEVARPQAGWFHWARRPAWAMSLAAVLFAGARAVGVANKSYLYQTEAIKIEAPSLGLPVQPGTAVGDLQALERNDRLYADFDVLDELQVQDDVTANP